MNEGLTFICDNCKKTVTVFGTDTKPINCAECVFLLSLNSSDRREMEDFLKNRDKK